MLCLFSVTAAFLSGMSAVWFCCCGNCGLEELGLCTLLEVVTGPGKDAKIYCIIFGWFVVLCFVVKLDCEARLVTRGHDGGAIWSFMQLIELVLYR
jgi:hypothetical protein